MKTQLPQLRICKFISEDTRLAPLWLVIRFYVGWQWLSSGWGKFNNSAWVGENAGTAITGFLNGAVAKSAGDHPAVLSLYADLISNVALPNASLFSYLVTYGEILTGLALILGFLTYKAAGIGAFMNLNFMFAGSAGLNPLMFVLQVFLMIAWRTSGWIGLDRWILPWITNHPMLGKWFVKDN